MGKSPNTIQTKLSAISFIHRIQDISEPVSSNLVHQTMIAIRKGNICTDVRLPITITLLDRLCRSLQETCLSHYHRIMYNSMFLLAFFALLRVGEFTISQAGVLNNLQLSQIHYHCEDNSLGITFTHFKHSNGRVHTIRIDSLIDNCPVKAMLSYLNIRGLSPGPLFIDSIGSPISRHVFNQQLNRCLNFLSLSPSVYKTHSFRIGAATYAASLGWSDAKIRHMGRWNSNAFHKYIRL